MRENVSESAAYLRRSNLNYNRLNSDLMAGAGESKSDPQANSEGMDIDSDSDIIESVLAGSSDQFGLLVDRHQERLYRFLFGLLGSSEDAEDVLQEAFVKAYKSLGRFEKRSRFYTWLQVIARNLAISHLRKLGSQARKTIRSSESLEAVSESRESDGLEMASQQETSEIVRTAISKLPIDRREILLLRDLEDMDYGEIAKSLEIPIGTVRSRLHRARAELKLILESYLGALANE